MVEIDVKKLPVLDYPPLTVDFEQAKADIDKFGMCFIRDGLSKDEVAEINDRLNEQAAGEHERKLGTLMRGDEGYGVQTTKGEKVSRLVWNLMNKGECFLPLIDHPKALPLIEHILGKQVLLASFGAHMNGSGNEMMPLHQDQWPLIPHHLPFAAWANVFWLITDNSPENGGTRLIPGSHKWPDISSREGNSKVVRDKAKSVTAPAGTIVVFDGRIWHSNGLNRSGAVRNNISIAYAAPWVRTQENHAYTVREEVLERANQRQKELLGFANFGTLGGHDGSSVSAANFDRKRESIGILAPQ